MRALLKIIKKFKRLKKIKKYERAAKLVAASSAEVNQEFMNAYKLKSED